MWISLISTSTPPNDFSRALLSNCRVHWAPWLKVGKSDQQYQWSRGTFSLQTEQSSTKKPLKHTICEFDLLSEHPASNLVTPFPWGCLFSSLHVLLCTVFKMARVESHAQFPAAPLSYSVTTRALGPLQWHPVHHSHPHILSFCFYLALEPAYWNTVQAIQRPQQCISAPQ